MKIQHNIQLSEMTTFGVASRASDFAIIKDVQDLMDIQDQRELADQNLLILGGGSNILFTQDFHGLVLKNEIAGIEKIKETQDHIYIRLGAGENWHHFVMEAVKNNWSGVENLSLIPGCCGAAPMQNIGAYGVEIKEFLHCVEAYHIPSKSLHRLSMEDCELGYRESIFKNKNKGEYIILYVELRLNKKPDFRISYGAIQEELEKMKISELSISAISDAVISIRKSKLPDPSEIGNAGSFFKNPIVDLNIAEKLKKVYPNIPTYPVGDKKMNQCKIAAGWMIDQAGWKGKRILDYGVHSKQALVLVNYGQSKGSDIFQLSADIIEDIKEKFGVQLEREVNII